MKLDWTRRSLAVPLLAASITNVLPAAKPAFALDLNFQNAGPEGFSFADVKVKRLRASCRPESCH